MKKNNLIVTSIAALMLAPDMEVFGNLPQKDKDNIVKRDS